MVSLTSSLFPDLWFCVHKFAVCACFLCFLMSFTPFWASQVEHVVREEKLRAAYELVEIYCELIAARLAVVESQKYVNPFNLELSLHFVVICVLLGSDWLHCFK